MVLRIDQSGGFVTPAVMLTRLPTVTVYGDGRMITEGPTVLVYPGPALPNIQVTKLDAEQVKQVVERARAAGVGSAGDLGSPQVADVPETQFTLRGAVGVEETTVEGLNAPGTGLTAEQQAAREKLRDFAAWVPDLALEAGAETQPYRPTAVAAVAEPWVANDEAGKQTEVAWPGPDLPGTPVGTTGVGCVTVTGDQVPRLLDAAAKATAATPWTSGGKRWTVALRPLLPDETDCGDLLSAG